jgi:predicted regulator of Ras-like GTPase activity (Roadblock/LC7/MglB family)
MSFESILQTVVDECGGGLAAVLMGSDGIPIAEVQAQTPNDSNSTADIGTAGVEFARVLSEVRKASDASEGGGMKELVVGLENFTLLFRSVDEDILLVLALAPDGNLGKARYLMRRHLLAIRQEL